MFAQSFAFAWKLVESFLHPPAGAVGETAKLGNRERQVLDLLAAGRLYKEIAEIMSIGLGTVKTHIQRIYEKLHVHSRAEAVAKARSG